jgi:uncharacterized protein (TIGR03083 family)
VLDHLEAIRRDSDRFYAAAESADANARVPSCPDWNIADLVWHLGRVHWFWASVIEQRVTNPESVDKARPERPSDHRALIEFGRAQADRMLSIFAATDDSTQVWTWALDEKDHTVGFIRRHQVQEAALHRWDMQRAATGTGDAIEPDVASDSIDEMLAVQLPWSVSEDKPLSGTVHLHCTDTDGEWFVHPDGRVERIHARGDVAIRGAASELLLALYKRVPLGAVDVIGDTALATEFAGRVNTS